MKRDYSQFPNDENGDILFSMARDGDNLSKPRDIDFSVIFPAEEESLEFASLYKHKGLKAEASMYDGEEGYSWEVVVTKFMLPTHEAITAFENELAENAKKNKGQNDGWGCFAQK